MSAPRQTFRTRNAGLRHHSTSNPMEQRLRILPMTAEDRRFWELFRNRSKPSSAPPGAAQPVHALEASVGKGSTR